MTLSVKDFGAVGDGVTDDAVAIQNCINAVPSSGDEVFFPPAVYAFSVPLVVQDKPNIRLMGEGAEHDEYSGSCTTGTALKWIGPSGGTMLTVGSLAAASSVPGNAVEGISFNANGLAGTCLKVVSSWHGIYRDLFFLDPSFAGLDITTTNLSGVEDTQHCLFDGITTRVVGTFSLNAHGMRLGSWQVGGGNTSLNHFRNLKMYHQQGYGIYCGDCDGNTFEHVVCNVAAPNGYSICLDGSQVINKGHCRNNIFLSIQPKGGVVSRGIGFSQPAAANRILCNLNNSVPLAVVETGSTLASVYVPPLAASIAYSPPNLSKGTQTTITLAVSGAAVGDLVLVGFSQDIQGLQLTGYVSAPNTVTALFQNGTGSNIHLAAGTLKAEVLKTS